MPHIPEHLLGDAFSRGGVAGVKAPFDLSPGRAKVKRTLKSAGPQAPPPGAIPTNRPSIFQRAGGAISSAFSSLDETLRKPETGKFLSQLGAAINPRSQVSAGLSTLGTSIAESRSETAFRERAEAGEKPSEITGGLTGALSSEQRSKLIGEALRGRESESLIKLREAQSAQVGQESAVKPIFKNLALTEGGEPSDVLNTFSVDPVTGDIIKFIGPAETVAEEKLEKTISGAEFNAIDDILARDFHDIAVEEIGKGFTGTETQLRDLLSVLDRSEITGRISITKLFSSLPLPARRKFRERRAELERGLRSGKLLGELAPELQIDTLEDFEALTIGDLFVDRDGVLRIKIDEENSEVVE